jgi:hypothetical protein
MDMETARIVRKNRRTGSEIEVCTADSQGMDPDGGKWVTLCWTHHTMMNHETRWEADRAATTPDDWCEGSDPDTRESTGCRAVWEAKQEG